MLNQTCAMKLKLQEALDKQEHGMYIFSVYSVMYTVLYSMYIILYSVCIMYSVVCVMYMYTVDREIFTGKFFSPLRKFNTQK